MLRALLVTGLVLPACLNVNAQGAVLPAIDFQKKMASVPNAQVVDVRTADEFGQGHIKNARNMDWWGGAFDKQAATLDKKRPVFVYCLSGARSSSAARKLRSLGFSEVYDLKGGLYQWNASKLPLVK
jgi:rhodanese-related sulfurtransferase